MPPTLQILLRCPRGSALCRGQPGLLREGGISKEQRNGLFPWRVRVGVGHAGGALC